MKKVASRLLELGLNPVPVRKGTKEPIRKNHPSPISEEEIDSFTWDEIGISTGSASGNLEVLDFDLKNTDNPRSFVADFKKKVDRKLLGRLVVQKTPSKGYHFIYRCDVIESSQKLAKNEEGSAIIETRGFGGYIKCFPSEGYEIIQGSFSEIPSITSEERMSLFVAARLLNKLLLKDNEKRVPDHEREFESKFPEFDGSADIGINLLKKHGWKVHSENDEWVQFWNPQKKRWGISAGYNKDSKFFFCFSTKQDIFITERPYSNRALFAELEHEGNYKKAYAILHEEGWGVEEEEGDDTGIDFLSDEIEENTFLEQAVKGEVEHGLVTGWKSIDDHFRLKKNSINLGIGFDNVGKSNFMASIMVASNLLHRWKWGVIAPENKNAENRQTLIETVSGRPVQRFKMRMDEYYHFRDYTRKNFKVVANKKHYSIKEVIDMGKRMYEYEGINALLIDPYNFFKGVGEYGADSDVLSELRVFTDNYCSVYVMAHPYTEATRKFIDADGYLKAPNKYSIQGGANFAYRVDDVFILHRIVNHPSHEIRRTMQFIVDKIKQIRTGGQVHQLGEYSELIWEERDGFLGYWDEYGNNPMYTALLAKMGVERLSSGMTDKVVRLNYF